MNLGYKGGNIYPPIIRWPAIHYNATEIRTPTDLDAQNSENERVNRLTEALIQNARVLAESLQAKAIVVDSEIFETNQCVADALSLIDYPTVVAFRSKQQIPENCGRPNIMTLTVPNVPMSRTGQIKVTVLVAVAEKMFERGDLIICLSGVHSSNRLDMLTILKVGDEPEFFLTDEQHPLPPDVDPSVFERVLSIASELAVEGRESRSVGALFVIGDSEAVLEKSKQLVINPFHGYPESERNILKSNLDDTIKEFANIDGAFIIRGDGCVLAAGRYLVPQGKTSEPLRGGLGARHESAAAITRVTDAVAVVLSQSTATITVFNSGRIMTEIERIKDGSSSQALRFKRMIDGSD